MSKLVRTHRDLSVYQTALAGALAVSKLVKKLPRYEDKLADQARRAARSPAASIAEGWRKRRYPAQWINKLSDAESEAAETQYWLEIIHCEGYSTKTEFDQLFAVFERVIAQLVTMSTQPEKWVSPGKTRD